MSNQQQIILNDKGYDGTAVTANRIHFTETGEPDNYIAVRTTGGRVVHVSMEDMLAFAQWVVGQAS